MRRAWLVLATAGCGFRHGALGASPDDAALDGTVLDGAIDARPDAKFDARIGPFCDPQDPDLVACYQFENNTNDASGHNLNATSANVSYVTGKVGKAMQFGATSSAEVADSALLDVSGLTVEAWIKLSQLPASGARMGIVDMDGQWGFFVQDTGAVRCSPNVAAQGGTLVVDQWTHVACTHDTNGATAAWINGVAVAVTAGGTGLSTASTSGMSIAADNPAGSGARLIGLVDQLRVYSRARTDVELCADAGCP